MSKKVKYLMEIEVDMADVSEQVIKGTGITIANMMPNVLDHDANSTNVNVQGISGSVTLDFDCLETV